MATKAELETLIVKLNKTVEQRDAEITRLKDLEQVDKAVIKELSECNNRQMEQLKDVRKSHSDLIRERNQWEERAKSSEKQYFAAMTKAKGMLMSFVYGIDMIQAATTHHEKDVVCRHMRTAYEGHALKEEYLRVPDQVDIPF